MPCTSNKFTQNFLKGIYSLYEDPVLGSSVDTENTQGQMSHEEYHIPFQQFNSESPRIEAFIQEVVN